VASNGVWAKSPGMGTNLCPMCWGETDRADMMVFMPLVTTFTGVEGKADVPIVCFDHEVTIAKPAFQGSVRTDMSKVPLLATEDATS
jgi:hypothetical protein